MKLVAFLGVFPAFHRAVFRLFRSGTNHVIACCFQGRDHFLAAAFCQMSGKESAIAGDESEGHLFLHESYLERRHGANMNE